MGDKYLRRLLVVGMTSLVRRAKYKPEAVDPWLADLLSRKPARLVTVALANKAARVVWAIMVRGGVYRRTAQVAGDIRLTEQRDPQVARTMRCDGEPVRPGTRTTRRMSRASQPDKQNGTLSADTIRASGHSAPQQQAGHKTAPDQHAKTSNQPLQCGSHPHRTFPFGHPHPQLCMLLRERKSRCFLDAIPSPVHTSARFSDWLVRIPKLRYCVLTQSSLADRLPSSAIVRSEIRGHPARFCVAR